VIGPRVLEIGCGPGWLLLDLLEAGDRAYGCDLSPRFWRQTGHRLRRRGYPDRLIGGDARALPFLATSFDTLVLTFPAPFVRDLQFWHEAARVLRPDGRLVIVEAATAEPTLWPGLFERAIGRWSGAVGGQKTQFTIGGIVAERKVVETPRGHVWLVIGEKSDYNECSP